MVWEVEFDRQEGRWYYDEKKQTYPMVVKVSSGSGDAVERIGPKVTDAEKSLLSKWKKERAD